LALQREDGDKRGSAISLSNLGHVATIQGDPTTARALVEESLALWRELGRKPGIAAALNNLGNVVREQGDLAAARALFAESLVLQRELGSKEGMAGALANLGLVARDEGDYPAARARFEESLMLWREQGNTLGIVRCLEELAAVTAAQEQPQRAARLWGVAAALREVLGAPLSPDDAASLDGFVATARARLDEASFQAAWAAGRALPLDAAVALALSPVTNGDAPTAAQISPSAAPAERGPRDVPTT
jgi:tetratricopeptide (TPR) repeat protein